MARPDREGLDREVSESLSHGLATWAQNVLAEHQNAVLLQRNNFLIIMFAMKLVTIKFKIYFRRRIMLVQVS